jgi:cytochrome c553
MTPKHRHAPPKSAVELASLRAGDSAQPMQSVVAKLTQADMTDLAAYAASLNP